MILPVKGNILKREMNMMPGICFMTEIIKNCSQVEWSVFVHLYMAVAIAFIPIVSRPWFVGYKLKADAVTDRKIEMLLNPSLAFFNNCSHYEFQFIFWNAEFFFKIFTTYQHMLFAG